MLAAERLLKLEWLLVSWLLQLLRFCMEYCVEQKPWPKQMSGSVLLHKLGYFRCN